MATEKVGKIIEEKNPSLENKDEVAEAVGVGAVVFYYLTNSRIKDSDFNLDEALSFEGNTGPYAQYTYARCCSIVEKSSGIPDESETAGYSPCEAEAALARTLSLFPEKVTDAIRDSRAYGHNTLYPRHLRRLQPFLSRLPNTLCRRSRRASLQDPSYRCGKDHSRQRFRAYLSEKDAEDLR